MYRFKREAIIQTLEQTIWRQDVSLRRNSTSSKHSLEVFMLPPVVVIMKDFSDKFFKSLCDHFFKEIHFLFYQKAFDA